MAVVIVSPYNIKILNKNTPNNACKNKINKSLLPIEGNPSNFTNIGNKIMVAIRNLSSDAKNTGKL
jgi:hypothetical protein